MSDGVRNQVIKSLVCLSKYLGVHKEFKRKLEDYGVKVKKPSAFSSFLRIFNNKADDVLAWYRKAVQVLRPNEKVFLKFALMTGLRTGEAINSFNLIVKLGKEGSLHKYYNEELCTLEHFRFKELFLRGTKNVFISILPKSLILEVSNSETLTYNQLIKRLMRRGLRCKVNELRDYFGSFMIRHGLIREEQDLLCGRIPTNIFIRHYWSPSFKNLRDRTLMALQILEAKA